MQSLHISVPMRVVVSKGYHSILSMTIQSLFAQRGNIDGACAAGRHEFGIVTGEQHDAIQGPGPELFGQHSASLLIEPVAGAVCDDNSRFTQGGGRQKDLDRKSTRLNSSH